MPTYRTCESDVADLLEEVLDAYHPDLREAGVTFTLLFAHARTDDDGNPVGHALKLHGQPALATVKINSVKDRVEGKTDATICVDGDQWPEHSNQTRLAILDHECEHLIVVRDESGAVTTDDANRPKLKMREHDIVIGGFQSVARRHQKNAVESRQYIETNRFFSQSELFPWG